MRAICFDLDGTLLEFTRPYGDVLAEAFEEAVGESREAWLETYNEAFFAAFRAHEPDPVRRGFAAVAGEWAVDASPDRLADHLLEREIASYGPPEGVHGDLDRLGETHTLGVVTNGVPDWQRAKLRAHDLERHFDAVVVSYETGAHKPDAAPFRAAEERLGGEAYAMVGDSDDDVDGARAVGWTAHRYTGEGFGDLPGALGWE